MKRREFLKSAAYTLGGIAGFVGSVHLLNWLLNKDKEPINKYALEKGYIEGTIVDISHASEIDPSELEQITKRYGLQKYLDEKNVVMRLNPDPEYVMSERLLYIVEIDAFSPRDELYQEIREGDHIKVPYISKRRKDEVAVMIATYEPVDAYTADSIRELNGIPIKEH